MNSPGRASIVGLGCATPAEASTQEQAAKFAIRAAGLEGDAARFAETIYARSGIDRRSSALLDRTAPDAEPLRQSFYERSDSAADRGPSTAARMRAYAALAPELAREAAAKAIADAGDVLGERGPAAITHLVIVSCTGFSAPGLDVAMVRMLGLAPTVERLTIGFMGCHGGVIGLRTARALALAAPPSTRVHVLLVCIELCSLHFQYSSRPDQIVANALFADGAAAAIVSNHAPAPDSASGPRALSIASSASRIFASTEDAMGWTIGDHGFEMTLHESVPELIRTMLGPWLRAWLDSYGISHAKPADISWAIHPGGPRVLSAVGDALGPGAHDLELSRAVLRDHGNMSSPTVLFILDRIRKTARQTDSGKPIVILGFGPGLSVEALLLQP